MNLLKQLAVLYCLLTLAAGAQAQTTGAPPVADPALRQELLKMVEQDQAIRKEMIEKGSDHPDKTLEARMTEIDRANTARVKEIVRRHGGWPGPELVGPDGTEAAFLIVQHADHATQKEMLPLVRGAYQSGKLSGWSYAALTDRVLVGDGKPQVYGMQAKPVNQWKGREPVLYPIEDEANVDKRRAELGMPPLSEYIKGMKQLYFPQNKDKK